MSHRRSSLSVRLLFFAALVFSFVRMGIVLAEENKANLNELIQEIQKRSEAAGDMTIVWWMPEDYWRASLAQSPTATPEQMQKILDTLRPYTLFAVIDGKVGTYGGVVYKPEAETRASIKLKDSYGNGYLPLGESEINADAKSFLLAMKPALVSVLGPMGQNMYFFVFPAKDKEGRNIADAKKEGSFVVQLGDREFKWSLPLPALLLAKICPTCKEKLSGAYKFCPWDGTKLPE